MITLIDKDGNEKQVEHNELVSKIEADWNGLKASNIIVDLENGSIVATIEKVGDYVGCGWVEDFNSIYNTRDIMAELRNA